MNIVAVFIGGGLGSCARYLLQGAVQRWSGSLFPWGTLVVNIAGSFIIGVLMASLEERFLVQPSLRLFLTVGILGGFTTFSSFSYETMALLVGGSIGAGIANAGMSLCVCLLATWAGFSIGRFI